MLVMVIFDIEMKEVNTESTSLLDELQKYADDNAAHGHAECGSAPFGWTSTIENERE